MSAAAKRIIEDALKLDPAERTSIAHQLLESVDSRDVQLSPAWEAEIQRRLRKIESGEATFVPAEKVLDEAHEIVRTARARR